MTPNPFVLLLTAALAIAGCANVERSRDLANPAVSATTLAQQVCSNCHGPAGNAVSPNFPNLAGQMAPYVVAQLNGFKSQNRRDPAGYEYMWGLSRRLSDAQIQALGDYYASQTLAQQPGEGDPARIEPGRAIFENGVPAKSIPACSGCHGPMALGLTAFPRLAGQHADYIAKQLVVFQRTDDRPEGNIMKTVAHEMSEQDIADVAVYLQSLQR